MKRHQVVVDDYIVEACCTRRMTGGYLVSIYITRGTTPLRPLLAWEPTAVCFSTQDEAIEAGIHAGRRWLTGESLALASKAR